MTLELGKYSGSVTFKIGPHIKMWDIQISRIKSDSVVGIHEIKADLDKAMKFECTAGGYVLVSC